MTTELKRIHEALSQFGHDLGVLTEKEADEFASQMQTDNLLIMLQTVKSNYYSALPKQNGERVDVFWDRQGWYFVQIDDYSVVSSEFADINDCLKTAILAGYKIRDVRRTRGPVPAPKTPLTPRKVSDAE